jgi:hypothetical protein
MKDHNLKSFVIGRSSGIRKPFPLLLGGLLLLGLAFSSCKKNNTTPPPAPPEVPAPGITDFSPKRGDAGNAIVITGTNFDATAANNTVKFNGVTATVTLATATQLTVTVPQGAVTGKITTTVSGQTGSSSTDFKVNGPLTLSSTSGITNQLIYLTGGSGFGAINDSNSFAIFGSGTGTFSTILGYNEDTLVLLIPYRVPGVYNDTAWVDGVKHSMGTFKVDTPVLTTMGVVGNVTPGTAAKGTTVTVPIINGSLVANSTTVALVAIYQHTGTPVSLNCVVSSLTTGAFGTTTISFVVPDGVVTNTSYAVKVTVNGLTAYGGLNAWFTAG